MGVSQRSVCFYSPWLRISYYGRFFAFLWLISSVSGFLMLCYNIAPFIWSFQVAGFLAQFWRLFKCCYLASLSQLILTSDSFLFDSENNGVRSEKFNFGYNLFQDFGKSSFFKFTGDADFIKVNDSFVHFLRALFDLKNINKLFVAYFTVQLRAGHWPVQSSFNLWTDSVVKRFVIVWEKSWFHLLTSLLWVRFWRGQIFYHNFASQSYSCAMINISFRRYWYFCSTR